MDVFISWSGDRSRLVALALRDWLPFVLQSVAPYVSSEDIEKGARWSTDIGRRLDSSAFGIVCVTRDNATATWLNFEAGALARSFDTSRVSPFLFDLTPSELTGPMAQFQATTATLEDVTRLVRSLNAATDSPLEEGRIRPAVELWWPRLDSALKQVPQAAEAERSPREEADILREVLALARSMQFRLSRLEDQSEKFRPGYEHLLPRTIGPDDPEDDVRLSDRAFVVLNELGIIARSLTVNRDSMHITVVTQGPTSAAKRRQATALLRNVGAREVTFEEVNAE